MTLNKHITNSLAQMVCELKKLSTTEKVSALNAIREALHAASPFKNEPVDFVKWERIDSVTANDWNPNAVAPSEMELLRLSIEADGYTQPIVADFDSEKSISVVVDGFHRNRVARECPAVKERIRGYLPIVQIRSNRTGRSDRIASTIRHNRARGRHQVEKMSQIVLELKRHNWSDGRIGKELGMDSDEILRLVQITGLAEAFRSHEFSKAWEVDQTVDDDTVLQYADGMEHDLK